MKFLNGGMNTFAIILWLVDRYLLVLRLIVEKILFEPGHNDAAIFECSRSCFLKILYC